MKYNDVGLWGATSSYSVAILWREILFVICLYLNVQCNLSNNEHSHKCPISNLMPPSGCSINRSLPWGILVHLNKTDRAVLIMNSLSKWIYFTHVLTVEITCCRWLFFLQSMGHLVSWLSPRTDHLPWGQAYLLLFGFLWWWWWWWSHSEWPSVDCVSRLSVGGLRHWIFGTTKTNGKYKACRQLMICCDPECSPILSR